MKIIPYTAALVAAFFIAAPSFAELNAETQEAMASGVKFKQAGNFKRAIERFREATRLSPDYPDGFLQLGFTLQHLEKYPEAIQAYESGLRLSSHHPFSPEAYYNMSAAADALNEGGRAIGFIKQSLQAYTDRNDNGGVYKAATFLHHLTKKYPGPHPSHP